MSSAIESHQRRMTGRSADRRDDDRPQLEHGKKMQRLLIEEDGVVVDACIAQRDDELGPDLRAGADIPRRHPALGSCEMRAISSLRFSQLLRQYDDRLRRHVHLNTVRRASARAPNEAGLTRSGASKVLMAFIADAVRIGPVRRSALVPITVAATLAARCGSRFASAMNLPFEHRVPPTCATQVRWSSLADIGCAELDRQRGRTSKRLVHLEDVIGRRQHHLRASSVRIIACSTLTICAMFVMRTRSACWWKMLRLSRGDQRVAQRVLLVAGSRGCVPGSRVVPGAPLIDHRARRASPGRTCP